MLHGLIELNGWIPSLPLRVLYRAILERTLMLRIGGEVFESFVLIGTNKTLVGLWIASDIGKSPQRGRHVSSPRRKLWVHVGN